MSFIAELWAFLRVRKKYWLAPVLVMTLILGGLIVLAQGRLKNWTAPGMVLAARLSHLARHRDRRIRRHEGTDRFGERRMALLIE